jgi:hypothetical protein
MCITTPLQNVQYICVCFVYKIRRIVTCLYFFVTASNHCAYKHSRKSLTNDVSTNVITHIQKKSFFFKIMTNMLFEQTQKENNIANN